MHELWALPYSPWSEKARWSLDHCGVSVREREYLPMLGEPYLRLRLHRRGRISVPLLIADGRVIQGSLAIARHAAETMSIDLFPEGELASVERWSQMSERGLDAGRALVTARVLASPEAKSESLPSLTPRLLRGALRPLAATGARFLRRKYGYGADTQIHCERLRAALAELRSGLGGRTYLIGEAFTYADLAMATVLQAVEPVTDEFLTLGPATREAWTDPALATDFADLVDWRNTIYERHR